MPQTNIKFGTDGWRAVISDTFTFANVRAVAQAIAEYMHSAHYVRHCRGKGVGKRLSKRIIIGYDTRFLSDAYAAAAAEVLAANGYRVLLMGRALPTPLVCHAIQRLKLRGGLVITASHNPAAYNGIKFRPAYAGASDARMTREVEKRLFRKPIKRLKLEEALKQRRIQWHDEEAVYLRFIKKYLNGRVLRKRKLRILVDSMYGAGARLIERVLIPAGHHVDTLHADPNPSFGGTPPEPIDKNLSHLMRAVRKGRYHLGLANDGDADRIGAVDEKGRFVSSQWIFALLLLHFIDNRRQRGAVVKSVATTTLLNRISEKYRLKLHEVPVGFKYIVQKMRAEKILIGGEESGGLTFRNTVPEKDGILSALLLVEMLCAARGSLSDIQKRVTKAYGAYHYDRYDWHFDDPAVRRQLKRLMKRPPERIAGREVVRVQRTDGLKFTFRDSGWLLLRSSGTEPVLRIYAESSSAAAVKALLKAGKQLAQHGC